jgi:HipA-like protein
MGLLAFVAKRLAPRQGHDAEFTLMYTPPDGEVVRVGTLRYGQDVWTFTYSDEYRNHRDFRPLEGFEDVDRVYKSRMLFPFFAVRLPPKSRPDIRRELVAQNMENADSVDLLRVFGRRAASSPSFELIAS